MGELLYFRLEIPGVVMALFDTDSAAELALAVFDLHDRHQNPQGWVRLRYKRRCPPRVPDELALAGLPGGLEEVDIDGETCWSSGARIDMASGPCDEVDHRIMELFALASSDAFAYRTVLSDLPF